MTKIKAKEVVKEEVEEIKQSTLTNREDGLVEFDLPIHIVQNEGNMWIATMPDNGHIWTTESDTPLNAIRQLTTVIELASIKEEKARIRRYMALNFDNAKALCLQIIEVLGTPACKDWFTVYQLTVKTGQPKEVIESKLKLLSTYGLLQPDRNMGAGVRWKVVDSKELQVEILNNKLELLKEEIDQIEFQKSKLLLNDKPTASDNESK